MTPVSADVCIVGGGLAGLAAACALQRAGASVVLIERRTESSDPNRGDFLPPRAVALLKQWGVELDGQPTLQIRSVHVAWGSRVLARRKLHPDPGVILPSVSLESILRSTAKAAGVDLRFGWQLQGLMSNASRTRVTGVSAIRGADFAVFEAKLVVGADGRASTVRDALGLRFKMSEKANELLAFEAELASASPTLPDSISFTIGRHGGGYMAPVSTRRVRVVAVTSAGESDTLSRMAPAPLGQELPARSPLPLGTVIDPGRVRAYEQTSLGHVANYAATGAVCIGDAAHPPPVPGSEGILMSLLDVEALVRLIAPALKENDKAIDKALAKLELERWPDNEKRLNRGKAALRWLTPLAGGKAVLARTPLLGRMLLSSLMAVD